jgi:DNA-binding CsgD family transcriptional regulator
MFRVIPLADGVHRVLLGGVPEEADESLAAAVFDELVPLLACAAVAQRQRRDSGEATLAALTLERLALPVLVVRRGAKVVLKNAAAERLLTGEDGLRVNDGILHLDDATLERELRDQIDAVLGPVGDPGGMPLCLRRRRKGARPLTLAVTPLVPPQRLGANREHALVLISDPDRQPEGLRESLTRSYGLTPSEARVAIAALQGRSLDQLARDLYISANTAKTHLKNIFLKVGVNRQSEMVAAILNGPVGLLAR